MTQETQNFVKSVIDTATDSRGVSSEKQLTDSEKLEIIDEILYSLNIFPEDEA